MCCLLPVHWRHPGAEHPRSGDNVHAALAARPELAKLAEHTEPDFSQRLTWRAEDNRSWSWPRKDSPDVRVRRLGESADAWPAGWRPANPVSAAPAVLGPAGRVGAVKTHVLEEPDR